MEAKSKAIELRDKHAKFQTYTVGFEVDSHSEFVRLQRAKQSALITVDEIIEALKITTGHCELRRLDQQEVQSDFDYWNKVKTEIAALM
jgi:hypothetical protein